MTIAARILDLSLLTRAQGFIIQGDAAGDRAGWSVSSAGDVNGDGFDDLIVGAPQAGEAYVIFGKLGATRADLDLSALAASDGFVIQGDAAYDGTGRSVSSAGDVNGDGVDDLIVGARYGDDGGFRAGEAYVIFGRLGATRADLDLSALAASDGFGIQGDGIDDRAGASVSSAGDVNGDGVDDLIVGAPNDFYGGYDSGKAYVIFGKLGATRTDLDLSALAASDGFVMKRDQPYNQTGWSVSSAGDVNGDGVDDLIVGAPYSDNGGTYAGEAYVIFGKLGATRADVFLGALASSDGFVIQGAAVDRAGWSVSSAGDVNSDGIDDLIVGAYGGDDGGSYAGVAYVLFGRLGATRADLDLSALAASDGFVIQGDASFDQAGWSVSSAGDLNGDGIDDLIVGAPYGGDGGTYAGEAYVIFGKLGATRADLDLSALAASDGFVIQGDAANDRAGRSVSSAGDVNGDGFDDLIVGAPFGDDGGSFAGEAYVIFGSSTIGLGGDITGTDGANDLAGTVVGELIRGLDGDDALRGRRGADVLNGGRGRDTLFGGAGNDSLRGGGGYDLFVGGAGRDTFLFLGAGAERIRDFELGVDMLSLGPNLTGGLTDAAEIVAAFASVVGSSVVLDFGDSGSIRLLGLTSTAGLADDILIF